MEEKLKKTTKDAELFWHFKHQRMALNLAVSALMLGPYTPNPDEKPEECLNRYLPLANAIDCYIRNTESERPIPWW
jgi:hypothetical protein